MSSIYQRGIRLIGYSSVFIGISSLYMDKSMFYVESETIANKNVYAWGSNSHGQLGLGNELNFALPQKVPLSNNVPIKHVAAAGEVSALLFEDGSVWTMGNGQDNRTGHAFDDNIAAPRKLENINDIVKIASGPYHMGAIDKNGHFYTWGRNWSGELGKDNSLPSRVEISDPIESMSMGASHSLIVSKDGKLYSFGDGSRGALGLGRENKRNVKSPTLVDTIKNVKQAAAGCDYSLILTKDGKIFSMGLGDYGQTCHNERRVWIPREIEFFSDKNIVKISAGEYHAAALNEAGEVYTFGYGKEGQCGHGDTQIHSVVPRRVLSLPTITNVVCGGGHTACIDAIGNIYMFGRGRDGQLGQGGKVASIASHHSLPLPVNMAGKVFEVALGSDHSMAIVEE